jgi:hypothetical protein
MPYRAYPHDYRQTYYLPSSLAKVFAARGEKKVKFVHSGMRVGMDTAHAGSGLSDMHAAFLLAKPKGLCQ